MVHMAIHNVYIIIMLYNGIHGCSAPKGIPFGLQVWERPKGVPFSGWIGGIRKGYLFRERYVKRVPFWGNYGM